MNRKKRISEILKKKLENFEFEVNDNSFLHKGHNNFDGKGETHIQIVLINKTNIKCNRLDIHRKINEVLENEYNSGLHSLEIKIID
tara:strand:+ start:652 stop:909 length:258 start_codon:yes stop_codon:yes gene_type:complete